MRLIPRGGIRRYAYTPLYYSTTNALAHYAAFKTAASRRAAEGRDLKRLPREGKSSAFIDPRARDAQSYTERGSFDSLMLPMRRSRLKRAV